MEELLERREGGGFCPPSGRSVVFTGPCGTLPNLYPLIKKENKDMHVIKNQARQREQRERERNK